MIPIYLEAAIAGNNLQIMDKLESLVYSTSIDSKPAQLQLSLWDQYYDLVEDYTTLEGQVIRFRFGWQDNTLSTFKEGVIAQTYSTFQATGSRFTVEAYDKSLLLNKGVRNNSYYDTPSAIVQQIGVDHQLTTDIETTRGIFLFIQPYISDVSFIKYYLRPKSIAVSSLRADYDLYFLDGTIMHYHPPRYEQGIRNEYSLFTEVTTETTRGAIVRIITCNNAELNVPQGSIKYTTLGYDYHRKTVLTQSYSDDNYRERYTLANKLPAQVNKLPSTYTENRVYRSANDRETLAANEAKTRFGHVDRYRFSIVLDIIGDPLVQPGDLINVNIPKTVGNPTLHGYSGAYLVHTCTHKFTREEYLTTIYGIKAGTQIGTDTLSGKTKVSLFTPRSNTNLVPKTITPLNS